MSPNPEAFLQHLRSSGYHPRSDKHSNALAEAIVADLVNTCPVIKEKALRGELVYDLNFTIKAGTSDWNVDLVVGPPPPGGLPPDGGMPIRKATPSTIHVAVEMKSVMTEHRKAVNNRKRDLEAHHQHVHRYDNQAIAAGVLVINQATKFRSPLRKEATSHRRVESLIEHCVLQMRSVTGRTGLRGEGLEAKCVIVLDMDNIDLQSTAYVVKAPAPSVGDPLHYDAFVQSVCALYGQRYR